MVFGETESPGTWIAVALSLIALLGTAFREWNTRKGKRDELELSTANAVLVAELRTEVEMVREHVQECHDDRKVIAEKFEKCEEGHAESSRRLDESEKTAALLKEEVSKLRKQIGTLPGTM